MGGTQQYPAWDWTPEQDEILTRMWNADRTIEEIRAAIGCSWSQVNRRRKRLGIPPRPLGWQPATPMADRMADSTAKPIKPTCVNPDRAFARAMAGRTFDSLRMKDSPTPPVQTSARPSGAGMWASSITLNA